MTRLPHRCLRGSICFAARQVFESENAFLIHHANAFEEGDETVVWSSGWVRARARQAMCQAQRPGILGMLRACSPRARCCHRTAGGLAGRGAAVRGQKPGAGSAPRRGRAVCACGWHALHLVEVQGEEGEHWLG